MWIKFNDYQKTINDITDSIWEGDSKNNLVLKAEEFYSEYKSAISEQMSSFASALDLYKKYKDCKINKESAEAALSGASEESAAQLRNLIQQYKSQMDNLGSQIKTLLDTVVSLKLESAVANSETSSSG